MPGGAPPDLPPWKRRPPPRSPPRPRRQAPAHSRGPSPDSRRRQWLAVHEYLNPYDPPYRPLAMNANESYSRYVSPSKLMSRRESVTIERIQSGPRMSQVVVHNKTVYLSGQ